VSRNTDAASRKNTKREIGEKKRKKKKKKRRKKPNK
jgi:hypothetical protein